MLQVSLTCGPLHYRYLEKEKLTVSKCHQGNLEWKIRLSAKGKAEIQWWINNSCHDMNIPNRDITIYADASLAGWGITGWYILIQWTLV